MHAPWTGPWKFCHILRNTKSSLGKGIHYGNHGSLDIVGIQMLMGQDIRWLTVYSRICTFVGVVHALGLGLAWIAKHNISAEVRVC